jgi:hypothetical protein
VHTHHTTLHYTTLRIGTSSRSAMMMEITERNPEIKAALYLCTLWRSIHRSSMLRLHEATQMMKQTNEQGQRCCCTYTENNLFIASAQNAFCFLTDDRCCLPLVLTSQPGRSDKMPIRNISTCISQPTCVHVGNETSHLIHAFVFLSLIQLYIINILYLCKRK